MSVGRGALRSPDVAAGAPGVGLLVPGFFQWRRGQVERALSLGLGIAAAVAVGVFAWGTPLGLAMWAGAYALHASSAADALRQAAFPAFARGVPVASAAFALGLAGYGPLLATAWALAWPAPAGGGSGERFLIDRWAYRAAGPSVGDWVGYRSGTGAKVTVARVVAGGGQEVHWQGRRLRIDGLAPAWVPGGLPESELALRVPEAHLLVAPEQGPGGLVLVADQQVVGRAWARYYPIRARRLLPLEG